MTYLPGNKLDGIILKGLQMFESGHEDLLQLPVSVRLEGHPGETLGSQDDRETSSLTALSDSPGGKLPTSPQIHITVCRLHAGTPTASSSS